jgi:hypothetical protein
MDHVHHLTYERKYHERLDDLQAICQSCHEYIHAKRDRDPILDVSMRGIDEDDFVTLAEAAEETGLDEEMIEELTEIDPQDRDCGCCSVQSREIARPTGQLVRPGVRAGISAPAAGRFRR